MIHYMERVQTIVYCKQFLLVNDDNNRDNIKEGVKQLMIHDDKKML